MWGPPKAVGLWPWNSETNWSLQHASVEVAQNTWLVKIVCSGWLLWTLKFAAHKSQSRCEDCNMIPAKTWPSWLPAVQWLLSSYWQWKHTEICRQLPLVQPLVSLVALSDWNQVPPVRKLPVFTVTRTESIIFHCLEIEFLLLLRR